MLHAFAWPVVAGDSVYVSLGQEVGCCAGEAGAPGAVVRLAADSGKEQWRFETPSPALRPTLIGDIVVAGTVDGTVYGLAASDGHETWRLEFPSLPALSVAVGEGVVILSDTDPALFGANVVQDSSRQAGRVWAIDASTGNVRWRSEVVGIQSFVATAGDIVVMAVNDATGAATIAGIEATSGNEIWRDATSALTTPPIVHGDAVVLAGQRLEKRAVATGATLWSVPRSTGSLTYWPVLFGDTVVISSGAATLEARSVADGGLRWSGEVPPLGVEFAVPSTFAAGGRLYLQENGIWTVNVDGAHATVTPAFIPQGGIQYLDVRDGLLVFSTSIGTAPTTVLAFAP